MFSDFKPGPETLSFWKFLRPRSNQFIYILTCLTKLWNFFWKHHFNPNFFNKCILQKSQPNFQYRIFPIFFLIQKKINFLTWNCSNPNFVNPFLNTKVFKTKKRGPKVKKNKIMGNLLKFWRVRLFKSIFSQLAKKWLTR